MIHYHGTPIGGTRDETARFLIGRHALVSFAHPDDMPIAAEACQSFVLDNGAFSVWKRGAKLDVVGYLAWVREWHRHPGFDWAIIPDVIEGTEEENDALLHAWPHDLPGCPVYHMHESLERAHHLANEWAVVAIGSSGEWPMPGTASWWKRMGKIMEAMTDELGRPLCKLHGLRMLDPEIFTRLPLASADSTNVAINNKGRSRFGIYVPPSTSQRSAVIAARIECHNSASIWQLPSQEEFELHVIPRQKQATRVRAALPQETVCASSQEGDLLE